MITASSVDAARAPQQFMNHATSYASGDCSTCHKETVNLTAGTKPVAFSKATLFHTGVPSGVTKAARNATA